MPDIKLKEKSIIKQLDKKVVQTQNFKNNLVTTKERLNEFTSKEERFEVTFRDGSQLKDEGVRQILVDKETGVNYLCWKSGYGAAITPLLDSEGKVIVTK